MRIGTSPFLLSSRGRLALRRAVILTVLCAAVVAVAGCGGKGAAPAADARAQGAAPAGQPAAPAQPAVPVAVQAAKVGAIASYYKATATLEAEKQAQMLARVSGQVRALDCEEGDQVREGAALLRIEDQEYQLRAQQAAARTANLQARFARVRQMREQQLATDEAFQTVKADLASAEAEEGLARMNLSWATVTAPFTGRVTRRLVNLGQTVSPGTPLFELSDFDPLLARVHVPSKEFKKLQAEQPVQLVLDSGQQRLSGRIKLISPVIDPASGTIKVTVEIPGNPAGVRPGDFAEVEIVTERHDAATLVPRIAVISEKGEDIVYVAADGAAERRVVTVGFTDNDNAEILTGLRAGESIVVKGQRSLKHGSPIKVLDEAAPAAAPVTAAGGVS